MQFNFVPDNREIREILATQVHGPYRCIHDALKPYVRIEPEQPGQFLTVHANDRLRLTQNAAAKRFSQPMDFAIIFDHGGVRLTEMLSPSDAHVLQQRAAQLNRAFPVKDIPREPVTPAPKTRAPRAPRVPRPKPMTVMPDPAPTDDKFPVCAALQELAIREKLDTDRDYVVIPEADAPQYAPLPRWAVASKFVDCIHVVRPGLEPGLGTDTPIRSNRESADSTGGKS